jgi:hypothetical protein
VFFTKSNTKVSNEIKNLDLTIFLTLDGISLSVFDESGSLLSSKAVLDDYANRTSSELTNKLKSHPEFELNYRKVEVLVDSDSYCLVPTEIIEPQHLSDLLSFQYPELKSDKNQVLVFEIENRGIKLIYTIDKHIFEAISGLFASLSFRHAAGDFIAAKWNSETSVFIAYKNKKADIVLFEKNQLCIAKNFNHSTNEDFLYNILSVYEAFKLDVKTVPTLISGIENHSSTIALVQKYIQLIHIQ